MTFASQICWIRFSTPVRFMFREGANPYEGKKNPLSDRQIKAKRRLMRHVKRGK